MDASLDVIDRIIAKEGTPLHLRPMLAATHFVELCILEVDERSEGGPAPPGELKDYAASKWFRLVYRHTEQWYRDRFGEAMDAGRSAGRDAVVLIRDTPYLLKVPLTTKEAETPGETTWLCFHDAVQPDENVLGWVQNGPNFKNLAAGDAKSAHRIAKEVATKLRATHIVFMGMEVSDPTVLELRDSILPHMERAARHLVEPGSEQTKIAHWDMQMACELALKTLAQQRAGSFKETHDLFILYDRTPGEPPPFARAELSKLPNWEKMAELRYGGGPHIGTREAFRSYRTMMTVVAASASALKVKYGLGKARFLIQRPPWMRDE